MGVTERLRQAIGGAADWLIGVRDVALATLPWTDTGNSDQVGPCADLPLVILPGILENPRYLRPLIAFLRAEGHPVTIVRSLGWNLSELGSSVDRAFAELAAADVQGAVILAHSKGGLIGKAMLLDPRSDGVLRGMVAVATPFNGSALWKRAQASAAVKRSPLGLFHPEHVDLARLALEQGINDKIVSLAPRYDQVVPGGSRLEGAVNATLPVAGHFRSVRDRESWDVIHEHVDSFA